MRGQALAVTPTPPGSDSTRQRHSRWGISSFGNHQRRSPWLASGFETGLQTCSARSNPYARNAEQVLPQTFRSAGLGSQEDDRCPARSLGLTDDEVFRMPRVTVRIRVPDFDSDGR